MKKLLLILMLSFSMTAFAGDLKPGGMLDGDMYNLFNNLNNSVQYGCYGPVGLAISATSTLNVLIATTTNYTSNGVWKSLASSANIVPVVATGSFTTQAASTYRKYLLVVNSSGAFRFIEGNSSAIADNAYLPKLIAGYTPIGYVQILTAAATTFKLGTTHLSDSGITDTYVDLRAINSGKSALSLTGL